MNVIELLKAASEALENAYTPYSNYKVGAALLCADGTIVSGCNVENASYGLTNCAERTAIFKAVSSGKTNFVAIAIVGKGETPPYPCGACRQVMNEFCEKDFPVFVAVTAALDEHVSTTLGELLPNSFGPKDLN